MASYFVSGYRILSNFEILHFWTDLAEIWPRGQILGADSESEVILAISCNFTSEKVTSLLNNRVAMATIKVTDKHNLYFWMLHG